ncbi:MAG: putative bifunctional diguanylate cyclase/phosphodiesterase [Methylomonas sp.]
MNSQPKILIVDDNASNRLSIRTILKGLDVELHEVDNGFDALSMTLNEDYALILLDALMPDIDGFEVCERLRANPKTKETPVIFLTAAFKEIEDNIRGYLAGATDYLSKPIDDHVLKAKVQVFLRLFNQQKALQHAYEELRIAAIAFDSQDGIVVTDADSVILRVNHAFSGLTGYTAEEAIGRTPALLKSGHHGADFYQQLWQSLLTEHYWQGEIWNRRKNGEIYPEWLTITAVLDTEQKITHYVAVFNDITQRKEAEEQIRQLAFYDPLTHLPNRRLLMDRLAQAQLNSARNHQFGAILFMDLDQFKTLNDTQGHDMGDLLLIEVAKRLSASVREIDTVARLGGDEFVLLLEQLGDNLEQSASRAQIIGEKILASIRQPYLLKQYEYRTTASIGISLFYNSDINVDTLFKHADSAMYEAKNSGRDTMRFFDPAMQIILETRIALEIDLKQALDQEQLKLYYQAQTDAHFHIIGAEVLLRWEHPGKGLILPHQFVPLAEDTAQMIPIGLWILESACRQIQEWESRSMLSPSFRLAINISACHFRHPQFVQQVTQILASTKTDPRRLKLELNEKVFIHNLDDTVQKMVQLKKQGMAFSIDDFGTGYSSLSFLKQLPLDQLKIDRGLINEIGRSANADAFIQTIIGMSHTLGLEVIAEGVENENQIEYLTQFGCRTFQGFLFSRPIPASDFGALLMDKKNL